ncbi:MAG: hypothetical protein HY789_09245 [Deltaproteobacteria bacterium]|nr:hypothetical protein [Deltaproteobacteria bacterium]
MPQAKKLWVFLSKKNERVKISLLINKLPGGNFLAVLAGYYGVVWVSRRGRGHAVKLDWVNDPESLV